jgi:MFS transporter, DHA1 family, inner membrane transport protein
MFFYHSLLHNRQFRYLGAFYTHSLVRLFATSIFQIFNGIYIYQTLQGFGIDFQRSIATTALIFALTFLIQALAVAPALWLIEKKGLKFAVFWGNASQILCYVFLALAIFDPIFFLISAIFDGIQLSLYWTAYHIYFANLTDDDNQGKEMSLNSSLGAVAAIGAPAFGGLVIAFFGYNAVFVVISILMVVAMIPLRHLPKADDKVPMDILKTLLALSPKKEFRSLLAYAGVGVSGVTTTVFWPVFVLPIVAGVTGIGFLGSLIGLFGSMSALAVGFMVDKFGARKILNIVSPLDSIVGLLRMFVMTSSQVFGISTIASATMESQFLAVDSLAYARGRHSNLVAIIVQREVGLAVGRFLFLLGLGILFWFGLPLATVFVLTSLMVLASKLYPSNEQKAPL